MVLFNLILMLLLRKEKMGVAAVARDDRGMILCTKAKCGYSNSALVGEAEAAGMAATWVSVEEWFSLILEGDPK